MFNVFKQAQEAITCRKKDLQLQEEVQGRRRCSAVKGLQALMQELKHMVLLHCLLRVRRNFRGRHGCINLLRAGWPDTLQQAALGYLRTRSIPRRLGGRTGAWVRAPGKVAGRPAAAPCYPTPGAPPLTPQEQRSTVAASRRTSAGSLRCRCLAGSPPGTRRASTTSRGRVTRPGSYPHPPQARLPSIRASHSRLSTER